MDLGKYGSVVLPAKLRKRGVSPIIATLLLVAIAVVGGAIIFSFTQGYFASTQLSGPPAVDLINVLGYDLSDSDRLYLHNQQSYDITAVCPNATCKQGHLNTGDYITVFLTNDGSRRVALADVRLAGTVYQYDPAKSGDKFTTASVTQGKYRIINIANTTNGYYSIEPTSSIEPGKTVTLVFKVNDDMRDNAPLQLKITTSNGAVKVATVQAGQREG